MKLFHLERAEDASGVSGVGKVAEGVVFDDGTVVLRWLTDVKSTVVFDSLRDVESVHGHEGRTRIVYERPRPTSTDSWVARGRPNSKNPRNR
jgi:hypothetical protein